MTEKIARSVVTLGAFAVLLIPLLVTESLYFPYITGKNFAFRIVVELMLAAYLFLAVVRPEYRPKRSWIFLAMGAFVVVVGLADIFGVNPMRSFWSNYERMEGFITILHLAAFLLVAGSALRVEKLWNVFFQGSLAVSALLSLYSFTELASSTPGELVRVDATLGNPTYFAVYLLFNIFIALLFAYRSRGSKTMLGAYGAVALIEAIALYNTGTRGTILGLVGGLGVAALVMAFGGRRHPRARKASIAAVAVLIALAGSFFAFRGAPIVQESPILSRFANISIADDTTRARLVLWQGIAWEGFKERPLLGWGQDNFIVVFGKHYDPRMYRQEPWFDRAHNVFVDWAISAGAVGLLAYLSLFAAGLWMLWRSRLPLPEKALLTGLFAAYGFHNLFVFDNLVSYIYFAALLAYLHAREAHIDGASAPSGMPLSLRPGVIAGGCAALALGMLYFLNTPYIARSQTLIDALTEDYRGNYETALAYYERALELPGTGREEAREQLVQGTIRAWESEAPEAIKEEMKSRARREMEASVASDPGNTRPLFFRAHLLAQTGSHEEGAAAFKEALAINPMRQNFIYELARAHMELGRFDEVITTFKEAYDVLPENEQALAYYAGALIYDGQVQEGEALLIAELGTTTIDNPILLTAYNERGMVGRIAPILELRLSEMYPRDSAQTRLSLALIYVQLGDRDRAILHLERVMELDPSLSPQANELLEALKAGRNVQLSF